MVEMRYSEAARELGVSWRTVRRRVKGDHRTWDNVRWKEIKPNLTPEMPMCYIEPTETVDWSSVSEQGLVSLSHLKRDFYAPTRQKVQVQDLWNGSTVH